MKPNTRLSFLIPLQSLLFMGAGLLIAGWPLLVYSPFNLGGSLLEASLVRMLGVYLAGAGFLLWSRRAKATGRTLLLANGFALVILFIQQQAIWETAGGWGIVAGMLLLTIAAAFFWWQRRPLAAAWQRPRTPTDFVVAANAALLLLAGAAFTLGSTGDTLGQALPQAPTGFEVLALSRLVGLGLVSGGLFTLAYFSQPQRRIVVALLVGNLLAFLMASMQQLAIWGSVFGWLIVAIHGSLALIYALLLFWPKDRQPSWRQLAAWWRSAEVNLFFYLSGCFLAVAVVTVYVNGQLLQVNPISRWVMVLETAVLLGLLLTAPLQQRSYQIRLAVDQLARLQPAAGLQPRWPFTQVMESLQALGEQLQQSQQMRGRLRQQIEDAAAQEERNRLARDLHDSIKQQLFAINVSAATAQTRWDTDPGGAQTALADVRHSAQAAMVEMNAMLQQLRPSPLENVGLVQALREQCEALALRTGAEVTTRFCELPPAEWWSPGAQTAVFRVAQEALANIARHARARHVQLALDLAGDELDANLVLRVEDDGSGFDPAAVSQGMGLDNMAARAKAIEGTFQLESAPGKGTQIELTVPLLPAPKREGAPGSLLTDLHRLLRNSLVITVVFSLGYLVFGVGGGQSPFYLGILTSLLLGLVGATLTVNNQLQQMPLSAPRLALQARSYGVRAVAVLAIFFIVLALPLVYTSWNNAVLISLLLSLLLLFLTGNAAARLYVTLRDRYYLLSSAQQVTTRRQVQQWQWIGWFLVLVLAVNSGLNLFFNNPSLPPVTLDQWLQSVLIGVTLVGFAVQIGLTRLLSAWRRPVTTAKEEAGNG